MPSHTPSQQPSEYVLEKQTLAKNLLTQAQIQFNPQQIEELISEVCFIEDLLRAFNENKILTQINFIVLIGYLDGIDLGGIAALYRLKDKNCLNELTFYALNAYRANRPMLPNLSMALESLHNADLICKENIRVITTTQNDPYIVAKLLIFFNEQKMLTEKIRQLVVIAKKIDQLDSAISATKSSADFYQKYFPMILSSPNPGDFYDAMVLLESFDQAKPWAIEIVKRCNDPMCAAESVLCLSVRKLLTATHYQILRDLKTECNLVMQIINKLALSRMLTGYSFQALIQLIQFKCNLQPLADFIKTEKDLTEEIWNCFIINLLSPKLYEILLEGVFPFKNKENPAFFDVVITSQIAKYITMQFTSLMTGRILSDEEEKRLERSCLHAERFFQKNCERQLRQRMQNYSFQYFTNPLVTKMNRETNRDILIELKNSTDDRAVQHEFDKQWGLTVKK